jgi:Ca-activated chloride channel family protein
MINYTTQFQKNKLSNACNTTTCLLQLQGQEQPQMTKRKALNLSMCIDVSGSMDWKLSGSSNWAMPTGEEESRLTLTKKAAVEVIQNMIDGDIVSVVAFSNVGTVIVHAVALTQTNRSEIIAKINALVTTGATNLHDGWVKSAEQVAKHLSDEKMNRILILSDGETNQGKKEVDAICGDVMKVYKTGISVSTFGVSESFNEMLLQAISNTAGGNAYYIDDANKFTEMFKEEFDGLSTVVGNNVQMTVKGLNGTIIKENMNGYKQEGGQYFLPNIYSVSPINNLFTFDVSGVDKSAGHVQLAQITLSYINNEGKKVTENTTIDAEFVDESTYAALDENKEVIVQNVLLQVAKDKRKAAEEIQKGNVDGAKGILMGSADFMSASSCMGDVRLNDATVLLAQTVASADDSHEGFKKKLNYQSRDTQYSK